MGKGAVNVPNLNIVQGSTVEPFERALGPVVVGYGEQSAPT